nr:zinc-ribbon domain-containing protein [uncultured Methanobrevibacter sp.]
MVKYCTECGTQLDDSAIFCTNCGTKIDFGPETRSNRYMKHLEKTGRKRANIPRLGGIDEFRDDSIVIKKTGEVIMIRDIENFSLHQSSRSLWSDVKVDFDYNGLHYRTQQAGSDKGKLQTLENKIKARDMQKYANAESNPENKIDKLKELKELRDAGIVNDEEFLKLKDEIING